MMGNTPQLETSVGALRTPGFQGPGWSMARMGQEPLNEGRKGTVIRHAAFPWWVFFPHLREGFIIPSVTKHRTPPSVLRYQLLTSLIILLRKEQHSEEVTSSRPRHIRQPPLGWCWPLLKPRVSFLHLLLSSSTVLSSRLFSVMGYLYTVRRCIAVTGKTKKLYGQSLARTSGQRRDNRGVQETPLRRRMSRTHKMGGR